VADDERPTQPQPPAEDDPRETARFDRPSDETAVMPPAAAPGEPPARWAARAGVPAGGPRQSAPEQQWVPDQPARTWWAPILIGVAILVLVGLIALGLWVAVRSKPGTPTSPTPVPSSAAPSSASPSPSPSPSPSASPTAALVFVPSLHGVALNDAEQILQSEGLGWTVTTQVTSDFPAGTVIDTNPSADSQVPTGTTVKLVVATAPPSPSVSPSPSD
jgi:PASTA domain